MAKLTIELKEIECTPTVSVIQYWDCDKNLTLWAVKGKTSHNYSLKSAEKKFKTSDNKI